MLATFGNDPLVAYRESRGVVSKSLFDAWLSRVEWSGLMRGPGGEETAAVEKMSFHERFMR